MLKVMLTEPIDGFGFFFVCTELRYAKERSNPSAQSHRSKLRSREKVTLKNVNTTPPMSLVRNIAYGTY